jgi:hypothetical protein
VPENGNAIDPAQQSEILENLFPDGVEEAVEGPAQAENDGA